MGIRKRAKLEDDGVGKLVVDELESRSTIGWGEVLCGDLRVDDDLPPTLRLVVGLYRRPGRLACLARRRCLFRFLLALVLGVLTGSSRNEGKNWRRMSGTSVRITKQRGR